MSQLILADYSKVLQSPVSFANISRVQISRENREYYCKNRVCIVHCNSGDSVTVRRFHLLVGIDENTCLQLVIYSVGHQDIWILNLLGSKPTGVATLKADQLGAPCVVCG